MAKEIEVKFPDGGVIKEGVGNIGEDTMPEAIIPSDKLPELLKANPIVDAIKSIAALPQVDRLVLYNRLDIIMNYDREKASHGIDNCAHLFDEAIKSL